MEKVYLKFSCFLLVCLLSLKYGSNAQIITNNGALFYIAPGAIVQSNGGFYNQLSSNLQNQGQLTVTKNSSLANAGNFSINGTSSVSGNGEYYVEQDWINNAQFVAQNSSVYLNGSDQSITGTNVTTFHNLILQGSGVKSLQINSNTDSTGFLNLNDRELATNAYTFTVYNPDTLSILKQLGPSGFVSSTGNGRLARRMNSNGLYLYPTGSTLGTFRYRPVNLKLNVSSENVYAVRLANNNATIDGYDINQIVVDSLCELNPLYYHLIGRTSGNTPASIYLYYDTPTDGSFDGIAQWNTPQAAKWNSIGAVSPTTLTNPNLDGLTKNNWANFADQPFVLGRKRVIRPDIDDLLEICGQSSIVTLSVLNPTPGSTYSWVYPSGVSLISQNSTSISLLWNGSVGGGKVFVYNTSGSCLSLPDSAAINILPKPTAGFGYQASGLNGNQIQFSDSSVGATSWFWDFGTNDATSNLQNPPYWYNQSGTFEVQQIVSNSFGCKDTAIKVLKFEENILYPNVFSPDGDGINDYFYFPSLGINDYEVEIYNRWGQLIFTSQFPGQGWDGYTQAGQPASEGTYFYLLKAKSATKDYSNTGYVMLVRGK